MKAFCVSDNTDTVMGMRLAGIEGEVIHERDRILQKLDELIQDKNIAIILMTTKTVEQVSDVVSDYKLNLPKPLIVEISDRHGSGNIGATIDSYISDATGIKL